jgi:small subunit ribosomal protein S6
MSLYEHVFLVRQDASPAQAEALTEQMKSVIESGGGKVTKTEQWGLRPLAFRIKKNRKAHYALMNIDAPWPAVAEMERQMKINEDVLRYLTVRVDELEEGPSAVMQRKDRDDERGERGDFRGGGRFSRDDDSDRRPFRREVEEKAEEEVLP